MSELQEFFDRVPRANLSRAQRPQSGPGYWRSAWGLRHSLTALAAWAVLTPLNLASAGWPRDAVVVAIVTVASAVAGLILASYVPAASPDATRDSTCAAAPALLSLAPTLLLSQQPATAAGAGLVSLVVVPALLIRLFGSRACPVD